jgi:hypothetical protein
VVAHHIGTYIFFIGMAVAIGRYAKPCIVYLVATYFALLCTYQPYSLTISGVKYILALQAIYCIAVDAVAFALHTLYTSQYVLVKSAIISSIHRSKVYGITDYTHIATCQVRLNTYTGSGSLRCENMQLNQILHFLLM